MKLKRLIAALLCAVTVTAVMAVPVSADWVEEDGKTYYTDEDGAKVKGFEVIDGSTYFFKSADGEMAKGWMKINGNYYYFSKTSGKMLAGNTYKIGGKTYKFDDKGVWDGGAGSAATTTSSASKGFKKGVWGEKMSATEKKAGDTWMSMLEGETISVGMDMDIAWTKYGDSKAIGSMDIYLYYSDRLFVGATMYAGTVPAKDGKPTSTDISDLTKLTKGQIDALAKSLTAKAEKNVGKAVSDELLKGQDTSQFDGFKIYANDSVIAAVVWSYDDDMIMYMEISMDEMAKASGMSVEDILSQLI
jgi:glucan-binding repeat-containing protein